MTNRVVLGALPGGGQGLRVSKPGTNVLTTGQANWLFDTDTPMLQVVESGVFSNVGGGASRTFTWPSLGYNPFVYVYAPSSSVVLSYNSTTSGTVQNQTNASTDIYWAVMNIPRGG